MYLHIVMMEFNKEVTPTLEMKISDCFRTIPSHCAGVERFELVANHSRTSARFTHALISIFTTEQALDTYRSSEAHAGLMKELEPHIQEIVVLDSVLTSDFPA